LVNKILFDGKKFVVECIVYGVFEGICEKIGIDFVVMFKCVFDNVKFVIEVKSCCVGGVIY